MVTAHIVDRLIAQFRHLLHQVADPWERLESYPEVIWKISATSDALALMEIQLAARWDNGLADRVQPEIVRFDAIVYGDLAAFFNEAGVDEDLRLDDALLALGAASQGFALHVNVLPTTDRIMAAKQRLTRDFKRAVSSLRRR